MTSTINPDQMVMSTDARGNSADVPVAGATNQHDIDQITAAAASAQPEWGQARPSQRADVLRKFAAAFADHTDEIVATADRETALGVARLTGETQRIAAQATLFADVIEDGRYLEVMVDPGDESAGVPEIRRYLIPVGTVAVFGASNFPLAFSVPGGDTVSALAAGCAVVAKAHPGHPATSELAAHIMRRVLSDAGWDPGLLGLVHGESAGTALVAHDRTDAVGFTGSELGGRALHDVASGRPRPIPFYGELGSVNPVVVTPSAAQDRCIEIAREYVASATLSAGQFCTKPGVIFVPSSHIDEFTEQVTLALADCPSAHLLTTPIRDRFRSHVDAVGSEAPVLQGATGTDGDQVQPAIAVVRLSENREMSAHWYAECFGPFSVIVEYDTPETCVRMVASMPGSLTATLHCADVDPDAPAFAAAFAPLAGRLVFNGFPTGVRVSHAMHHGGPFPSSTNPLHTSVGATSIRRWLRPLAYQNAPEALLPPPLQDSNTWDVPRTKSSGSS